MSIIFGVVYIFEEIKIVIYNLRKSVTRCIIAIKYFKYMYVKHILYLFALIGDLYTIVTPSEPFKRLVNCIFKSSLREASAPNLLTRRLVYRGLDIPFVL